MPFPYCILQVPSGADNDERYYDMRYLVEVDDSSPIQQNEVLDAKWFTKNEILKSDMYPSIVEVAKEILK